MQDISQTDAWRALQAHRAQMDEIQMPDLFAADAGRFAASRCVLRISCSTTPKIASPTRP
ncbi:MAG: hypothetical protein R2838_02205 [Caldilineaceae bacterium]